ncbi:hypothetical protein SAMN05660880_01013 [Luteibacter sp. 22Crub2.1]|nr:hypothetical protein SAMN05660880_01013 [Luteibacter sp. 22Crub2.1]
MHRGMLHLRPMDRPNRHRLAETLLCCIRIVGCRTVGLSRSGYRTVITTVPGLTHVVAPVKLNYKKGEGTGLLDLVLVGNW